MRHWLWAFPSRTLVQSIRSVQLCAPELLCGGTVVITEQTAQSLRTSRLPVGTADAFFRFDQRQKTLMV